MTFPVGTYTGAGGNLDKFIMEVWGDRINDFAKEARHVSKFFIDRSYELDGGGDTIHTPGLTEMSANSKSNATAVTLNANTETSVDLVIDTWKEVSFAIEDGDVVKFKKSYYLQNKLATNAAYTAAMTLEDAIFALFTSFTGTNSGTSSTTLADSDIRAAIGSLTSTVKEDTERGNYAFFFDRNVFWSQIAGIQTYQLNTNSPTADPVMKAPAKWLYGIPVYVSSRIPSSSGAKVNALVHRDAIHFAIAKLPGQKGFVRVQSNYVPQYLSTVTTADIQFGVIMNRASYGYQLLSSS